MSPAWPPPRLSPPPSPPSGRAPPTPRRARGDPPRLVLGEHPLEDQGQARQRPHRGRVRDRQQPQRPGLEVGAAAQRQPRRARHVRDQAPSGSFEVVRRTGNAAGTDSFRFRAVNKKNGEVAWPGQVLDPSRRPGRARVGHHHRGMASGPHVFLSSETGQPAVTADGVRVGRVVDLTVRLTTAHPVVHRVALGSGRRIRHLVPWSAVAGLDPQRLALTISQRGPRRLPGGGRPAPGGPGAPALPRRAGHPGGRSRRTADVPGLRRPGAPPPRTGRSRSPPSTSASARCCGGWAWPDRARLAPVAVDWEDLHLTSSRGHVVQLSTDTTGFRKLDAQGLAELLARLSTGKATDVIRTVGRPARPRRCGEPPRPRPPAAAVARTRRRPGDRATPRPTSAAGTWPPATPGRRPPGGGCSARSGWRRHRPPRRVPRTPPASGR